jgi:peroxiredoxin
MLVLGGKLWGDAAVPIASQPHQSRVLAPGQTAPNFVTATLDGQEMSLQAYRGRPVIINFWATWCEPCRREMPAFQAVYASHKDAGLTILAVSQDVQSATDAVRAYVTTMGLPFSPLLDPDGVVAKQYSVVVLPSTVFVHPDGTIAAIHIGPMTQTQMERYVVAILPH